MADRTAAEILGEVFGILAKRKDVEEAKAIALQVWPLTQQYDFTEDQMEADAALKKLGLMREVPDPENEGESMDEYGPKKRTSKRPSTPK